MRIGIIGSGEVATTLAAGFVRHDHSVTVGARMPVKLVDWAQHHPEVKLGTYELAAEFGELLVLAVKGVATTEALEGAGRVNLAGKIIIDATNPIADEPPINGVLTLQTAGESAMEQLQRQYPAARFVKAFNAVGAPHMVDPKFKHGPPTMFICGDDEEARGVVSGILREFGWDVADMGSAVAARAIEPLSVLWCIPGFLRDEWSHAFKLLRA